ncbi:hypothetical protein ACFW2V_13365 [Streptomyces sp. NPDC058947]|uniref:hypothetical protein n=1 Tax=Streptomyces sp. NPDC058947 TaxID=3346675 RepID=UPI0036BF072C
MVHNVVSLRNVKAPEGYMSLAAAETAGVRIPKRDQVYSVGPLRRGVVYRSGYWGTVNTVHDVFVRVQAMRDKRGRFAGRVACGFLVAEENDSDTRVRVHSTAWAYGRGNAPLFTIGE